MRKRVIALVALEILLVVGLVSAEFAMIPAARDPVVELPEGNWSDRYNYSVELRFNDAIIIELWVWNPLISDYCSNGTVEYKDIGNWTRIYWDRSPFSASTDYAGHESKFMFRWNGTDIKENEGRLRPLIGKGPRIKAIPTPSPPPPPPLPTVQVFKNATVKPAYGHYNDSFTYGVFAQLNQTRNIAMEVFDISSYKWKEAGGNQSYTETGEWQLLSWADVTNVSAVDSAGVASYRFFFFEAGERRESEVFYGPELDLYPTPTPTPTVIYSGGGGGGGGGLTWRKLLSDEKLMGELAEKLDLSNISGDGGVVAIKPPGLINATVTPDNGSWHESYNYSAVVEHPDRADMWLTLEVYCPGQGVTHIVSNKKISTYNETYLFNWNIVYGNDSNEELKSALNDNFKIDWMDDANISNSGEIINIYADNHSAKIIMDEKKEKATLKISDDRTYELKVKTVDDKLKIYYETNRTKVEWPGVNVFSEEDVRANKSPGYYILYNDGCNKDTWGGFPGPELYFPPVLNATEGIASNITGVRVGPDIKHSEFSLLWIIILAIIAGLAVMIGVVWMVYNRFFRREIEEEIFW